MKKLFGLLLAIFIVIVGAILIIYRGKSTVKAYKDMSTVIEKAAEKPEPTQLREIKTWKGQGIKKTETFTITTDQWSIAWGTGPLQNDSPGILQIYVYKEGGNMVDVAANVMGKNNDYSIMRRQGRYWLEINSSQLWSVGVYEIF